MLVPIRMGTNIAAGNQQKHLSLSFATKGMSRHAKALKFKHSLSQNQEPLRSKSCMNTSFQLFLRIMKIK